jgi:hypothetical protein
MNTILVPTSPGELLDKLAILTIKSRRISDPEKLANVLAELASLRAAWSRSLWANSDIEDAEVALLEINERLWDIEDRIREKERTKTFDAEFIHLARSVYVENDKRANAKKQVNLSLGSTLVEEKSYAQY